MAILPSSGFYGFISSAKKQLGKYVSTFVSGVSGWMIRNNGDAEFKSIYARDKIVTNEYIYNRIKVTEDEEIISTSGKIAYSYYNDEEESYTIGLDLREGDLNPFRANDLIQGYYHFPGNTGTVYAVQRMTVAQINEDQTMTVFVEGQSQPYPQMVIVRVGNIEDEERQAFIKISSKDNNQLFFDEINSFYALDDPNNVKMSVGKAQIGLIPAWASAIIGTFKKWFGLIADGVILRGVFVLQSSGKTIEKELEEVNETITEVETRFEIKEGQISSSVREAKEYAESANTAAGAAVDAGNAAIDAAKEANEAKIIATEKASEATQTADGFQTTVTEVTKKAVEDAVAGSEQVIEEMVGTQVTQSAREWKVEVLNGQETVIASINADEGGILIQGEKVRITGQLLADIIIATGLNIQDKFVVTVDQSGKADVSIEGKVITSNEGSRVEVSPAVSTSPAGMVVYGLDGKLASSFDGGIVNSINDLFGGGTLQYDIPSNDFSKQSTVNSISARETIDILSFTAPTDGVVKIPEIVFRTDITKQPPYFPTVGQQVITRINTSLYINDLFVAGGSITDLTEDEIVQSNTVTSASKQVFVKKGLVKLVCVITYSIQGVQGSGWISVYTKFQKKNALDKLEYASDLYISRYFSNGFALGSSTSNFFECLNVSNSMLVRAVMGRYGVNINQNCVQLRLNGQWYTIGVSGSTLTATQASLIE